MSIWSYRGIVHIRHASASSRAAETLGFQRAGTELHYHRNQADTRDIEVVHTHTTVTNKTTQVPKTVPSLPPSPQDL